MEGGSSRLCLRGWASSRGHQIVSGGGRAASAFRCTSVRSIFPNDLLHISRQLPASSPGEPVEYLGRDAPMCP